MCCLTSVMIVATARLRLHLIDESECAAIAAVTPGKRAWGLGYPTEGDVLLASLGLGPQGAPWVPWQIVEFASGLAIGGAGFMSAPDDGCVEIGYGIAPAYQRRGYATEAVGGLVALASDNGVYVVQAATDPGNVASQRVLQRSGFAHVGMRLDQMIWERSAH